MLGVVSVLDEDTSTFIRELWTALTQEFGFSGTHADSSPHVSFHVAEKYDMQALDERLKSLARSIPPLQAKMNGIGVFLGEAQVVYLPVVRQPRLTVLQRAVFDEVRHHATGDDALYRPEEWMPHITLGRWEAKKDIAGAAVRLLSAKELTRTFAIDNLSVIEETGEQRRVVCTYRLEP